MTAKSSIRMILNYFSYSIHKLYFKGVSAKVEKFYRHECHIDFFISSCHEVYIQAMDTKTKLIVYERHIVLEQDINYTYTPQVGQRVVLDIEVRKGNRFKRYKTYITNITDEIIQDDTISHAMGAIHGLIYTNSFEAFLENYSLGYRYFEVDLQLTQDNEIVLFHDISSYDGSKWLTRDVNNTTSNEFMKYRYDGKYKVLSALDLINIAKEYKDARFILDIKSVDFTFSLKTRLIKELYSSYSKITNSYSDNISEFLFDNIPKLKTGEVILGKFSQLIKSDDSLVNSFIPQVNMSNIGEVYDTCDYPIKIWRDSILPVSDDIEMMYLNGIVNYSLNAFKFKESQVDVMTELGVKVYLYNHKDCHLDVGDNNFGYFND
ncbi:glycerophosphodiester phosphodiesterase family protein [Vibrio splendidus]|uniref:Glycerophosphodiester phosphodiesterase family protein n=1 Tax=Vibrio splendidus TaxID=29497 RepID=A0ABD5AGX7_VIBSP|nr:glycerophosphodiester phosphodiesterase family protein [Vibrio splendidus]MDP2492207.1 glycerophosphodiester phosphodiesterase family protein [Vibrio splendidus]PMO50572.1 hypothetical protein BCT08_23520 [Vibrio splendidus]